MMGQGTARAKWLVVFAAVAMIAVACSSGGGTSAAPSAAAPSAAAPSAAAPSGAAPSGAANAYTIGYSNAFGIGNGFREEQLCTAKAQALQSGQVASGTWTNEKEETYPQLQQIRDLVAKKPSAIIFNPNGPDVLNPALAEANAAGIKTVALDAYVTDPNTLNISNDQVAYGYVGASWLFKQLNGTGNVYYMRGLAGHPADNDRHQGVLKALAENPGIKLLPNNDGVATGWDPDQGTKLITDLINSGGYDEVNGIWTSGIDQQIVSAIKAAGKPYVPIVGADLKGFVEMLLNKDGGFDGLKGIAVYNPAAIGGAGLNLALKALNGETIDSKEVTVKDSNGGDVKIKAIFLPTPEAYDNTTDAGKAKLQEIDVDGLNNLWPVSWYINGWTDYSIESMLACKGPGE
jgi:ribose transport system substrate-binding protein